MNFKFTFKGIPSKTHCYVYSGLSCWYNQEQVVWTDFKHNEYQEWFQKYYDDEIISKIMSFHINLAVVHGLIDQNMFYGTCKDENWDPLWMWNIKLILEIGMGDLDNYKFKEFFGHQKHFEPQSIMAECDLKTGELKIPYHYHKKRS